MPKAAVKSSSISAPIIVWFRQDLRATDNPALVEAAARGQPIIPLYILDDETPGCWRIGGAGRWYLHHALEALGYDLAKLGATLILKCGRAEQIIKALIEETKASAVFWNRQYEPFAITRDKTLKQELTSQGVDVKSFQAALLFEPWTIVNKTGEPYKVFTAFWRACRANAAPRAPLPKPKKLLGAENAISSDELGSWNLLPRRPNWAAAFPNHFQPGEADAHKALNHFIDNVLQNYAEGRNYLPEFETSRLSPHLHWGALSPFQIWSRLADESFRHPAISTQIDKFLSEIGWREFSHQLLYHWPSLPEQAWREEFDYMAWRNEPREIEAWRKGRTGIPVVDAAMRELWVTGYMHNRARMITASFLIKHLLCDWRIGQNWFWDTLLDADLANNAASWQWVAGSGADAAPYFRIFNPVTQGEKFDSDGVYIRRWLPELAQVPTEYIHAPWTAPDLALAQSGLRLGHDYPLPIVDLAEGRLRALAALKSVKSKVDGKT